MGHRCAKTLAVRVLIIATGLVVAAAPASASHIPPPTPVPLFDGWTFAEWFPAMFAQANEAYNTLGPIAWLVIGALLAGLAIEELMRIIWAARRGADRGDDDED
jgi:hypothetical protein